MTAAATTSAADQEKDCGALRNPGAIAEVPFENGQFELSLEVAEPRVAYFHVRDGLSKDGIRYGAIKGSSFILEAESLSLQMSNRGEYVVSGGPFNDTIYNSWKLTPEYLSAQVEYRKTIEPVPGETEDEAQDRNDAASNIFSGVLDLETEGRKRIALHHEDPMMRKLALESTWLTGAWVGEAYERLLLLLPDDPKVLDQTEKWREHAANRSLQKRISSGGQILDFSAVSLDGDEMRLSDVRDGSKVVLVEFWASWCGPCRIEIPHMKKAYEKHRESGFDIVSFTIDESREAWETASEEEDIPWHNLGMGPEAEAATAYSVTGVPKNYLVDSKSGAILSEDLRGLHLDRKLEEIFDESS